MPKAQILSPTMLNSIEDTTQLIKELNRQAERYNKQITRAKQSGLYGEFKKIVPNVRRQQRIKITPVNIKKFSTPSGRKKLIEKYQEREKLFKGGITKKNVGKLKEEKKKIEQEFFSGLEITGEQFDKVKKAQEYANTESALYYELLKMGVQNDVYKSYGIEDRPNITKEEFKKRINEELAKINKAVEQRTEEHNKYLTKEEQRKFRKTTEKGLRQKAKRYANKKIKKRVKNNNGKY